MIEAFPDDTAPRWLLRDRDATHGNAFQAAVGCSVMLQWTTRRR
jgi:hypothetical protein